MDLFKLQSHFVLPVMLSLFILGVLLLIRKRIYKSGKWKDFWISLIVFFVIYLLLLLSVTYLENYYDLELHKFDLNNDGVLSGNEISFESKAAMKKVSSDTARTFAPITGLFISGFIQFMLFNVA